MIEVFARGLLGGHVVVLALDHAPGGAAPASHGLRDTEVGQLHLAGDAEQDVLRRDVAVHDTHRLPLRIAEGVRVVEPAAHLSHEVDRDRDGKPTLLIRQRVEQVLQIEALDVLHHDEVRVVGPSEIERPDDVRVAQADGQLGLLREGGLRLLGPGEVRVHALDGYRLLEPARALGLREVDLCHPPIGETPDECVVAERPV